MQRIRKDSILQAVGASACALGLTLAIYLSGTGLGGALLRLQKNYRIDRFNQAIAGQDAVIRLAAGEELHTVTTQYLTALMDAVIRFEFFPRKEDAEIFLAILSSLPVKVTIDGFEFSGRNLVIHCQCSYEPPLNQFLKNLEDVPLFQDVSLESYQKKDGVYIGTLTCIAA
ncbi:MAG: PilN domain-containing protein [Provencibacterium sp.]|jgi:hypothetical protein|nr:PilN domain-containing protein [Provencibacterium sp.]